jgi:hypothetical protein
MRYLLLLTNRDEEIARWQSLSEEEQRSLRTEELPKWGELFGWIEQKGLKVNGLELDVPSRARTVRIRDGGTLVSDGPYAETKEQIGGFFVVECDDLDDAIELASRIPVASRASVEIRPLAAQ